MNLKKFLAELKRRNVWKAAMAYIIACWVILQVMAVLLPAWGATEYIKPAFFILTGAFPLWLAFSWIYEFTPDGLKKTKSVEPEKSIAPKTGLRLNKIILAALGIAIVLLFISIFRNTPASAVEPEVMNLLSTDSLQYEKSIAVLAFADMSPKKDQEYFSDGISEEILNLLAQIPELRVISRTSSFSFKNQDVTTEHIGKVLDVNHILEGSVRKSGNTLRITAQLINVADGAHLWSKTYDRDLADIFMIQDQIATEVAQQLSITLMGKDLKSRKVDTEAYTLFLQALYSENWLNTESMKRAEELLRRSIEIDSTYAPSWAWLSMLNYNMGLVVLIKPKEEALRDGIAAIEKAIEVDPGFAAGYAYLSIYNMVQFEFEEAAENANKAHELAPLDIYIRSITTSAAMASPEEMIEVEKKVLSLDPLSSGYSINLGLYNYWAGNLEEARKTLELVAIRDDNSPLTHAFLAKVYLAEGKPETAYKEALKEQNDFFRLCAMNSILFGMRRHREADKLLAEIIETYPEEASIIADIYAYRGEIDNAFIWLDRALATKDSTLTEALLYPDFKILYKDPRWRDFINRIGLPEGHSVPLD